MSAVSEAICNLFECHPGFSDVKDKLIAYHEKTLDPKETCERFKQQFEHLKLQGSHLELFSVILELLNNVLKQVDLLENETVDTYPSLAEDLLIVFSYYAAYPLMIQKTDLKDQIKTKLVELFNEIIFMHEIKKTYEEIADTRVFFRKFYMQLYAPAALKCVLNGIEITSEFKNSLLALCIIRDIFGASKLSELEKFKMYEEQAVENLSTILPDALNLFL